MYYFPKAWTWDSSQVLNLQIYLCQIKLEEWTYCISILIFQRVGCMIVLCKGFGSFSRAFLHLNTRWNATQEKTVVVLTAFCWRDSWHTAASLLIKYNASAAEVSKLLGHSTIGTTMNIYVHSFDEASKNMADKMNSILFKESPKRLERSKSDLFFISCCSQNRSQCTSKSLGTQKSPRGKNPEIR